MEAFTVLVEAGGSVCVVVSGCTVVRLEFVVLVLECGSVSVGFSGVECDSWFFRGGWGGCVCGLEVRDVLLGE